MELDELQPLCQDSPEQADDTSVSEDLDAEPLLQVSSNALQQLDNDCGRFLSRKDLLIPSA